jgi:5'-nucleotidase
MAIVLTNDDGIDAPGIQALREAVRQVSEEPVVTIAPKAHLSGCGHQVTTSQPIEIERRAEDAIAVRGTPADCTRLALTHLCPQTSWVLSGINAGGNMGVDEYISGTVAAVREAAIHGIPAIALSQYRDRLKPLNWEVAQAYAVAVLSKLMSRPLEPGCFWNVNFPHLDPGSPIPEIQECSPSRRPLPNDFRQEGDTFIYVGNYQGRERVAGSDVDVCFSGKIAVTQLRL